MKTLYSWVGDNDLLYMAECVGREDVRDAVNACIGNVTHYEVRPGAVKTAYDHCHYGKLVLFWTREKDITLMQSDSGRKITLSEYYRQYLGNGDIEICHLKINSINNYGEIYNKLEREIQSRFSVAEENDFLLTSGTGAMTSVMLLLGKTNYPARLLQVETSTVTEARIPFELSLTTVLSEINRTSPDPYCNDVATKAAFQLIKGASVAIDEAKRLAARFAAQNYNVMICGGNGVGKELFAQAIHETGSRGGKEIISINCAGFTDELLESELFGYEGGAFTGARKGGKDGLFKRADGGTLFMDEVGECSLAMQAKLLRVLQPPKGKPATCRVFRRVGGEENIEVDVRIITATNRDLQEMVKQGKFREDLYYRLATLQLRVPSLNERGAEDVRILAEEFLKNFNENNAQAVKKHFSADALKLLQSRQWPGNVRQLQHEVIQAAVMTDSEEITPDKFRFQAEDDAAITRYVLPDVLPQMSLEDEVNKIKCAYIEKAMEQCGKNMNKAKELLGYNSYQNLNNDLTRLNLSNLKKPRKKNK